MKLIHWECLEEMDKLIEQWVKVDAIITDPPYNITACDWDKLIPFNEMWERLNKLIKPNGAIVLFGSEPFSSALRMSNIKQYKYDWIWEKNRASNPMLSKKRPLKITENIIIFYKKFQTYNYQKKFVWIQDKRKTFSENIIHKDIINNKFKIRCKKDDWTRYPKDILKITQESNPVHPTQKPVALMEYLIKTYTNEWETVLDFTMGSWTTLVACQNTNRNWIWIELNENYFNISKERIWVK